MLEDQPDELQALDDDAVETINIVGYDKVFITHVGCRGREHVPHLDISGEQLIALVRRATHREERNV